MSMYIMLTVSTKYSRIPSDALKMKWYNAMMEIGKKPIRIDPEGVQTLSEAIRIKVGKMELRVLNLAILPDHIHINLYIPDSIDNIKNIVNQIKGYAAYTYNRCFQNTVKGKGRQNTLRAEGYSITYLKTNDHVRRAIEYVDNNHSKHSEKRGIEMLELYTSTEDKYSGKIIR